MPTRDDRLNGGLLGLLVGDAVGVPYEFHAPQALPARDAIELVPLPGFPRSHAGVPPGTWSDDGAQALCLLASLLERDWMDADDFAGRLLRWWNDGYMAVGGDAFDVGNQTLRAFDALARGVPAERAGPAGERDNGNGSLMRVLPLALWHAGEDRELVADAMRSSRPTHGHLRSQLCCALYCMWARRTLAGDTLDAGWTRAVAVVLSVAGDDETCAEELAIIDMLADPAGRGSGYVVDCLHSARLALAGSDSYEGAVKAAIALGDDTDTTAAVAGGIAGLHHGMGAIPARWLAALRGKELVDPLLAGLLARSPWTS